MTNSEAGLTWRQRAQCPGELKRKFSVVIVGSNRKACSKTQITRCFCALTSPLEATERHPARLRSHSASSVHWCLHQRASTAYAMWRFNSVHVMLHRHCIRLILLESLNLIELLLLCSIEQGNIKRGQTWRQHLFEMIQSQSLVLGTISYSFKSYLGSHGSSTTIFCLTHWHGLLSGHWQRT